MLIALDGMVRLGFGLDPMVWLAGWMAALAAYVMGCRRFGAPWGEVIGSVLTAELAVDSVWSVIYLCNPLFAGYGVGLIFGLPMWLTMLMVFGLFAVVQYRKRNAT